MDRALAVVDATDAAIELVEEAGELAEGVGVDLVLLHVTTEEDYADRRNAMESIANYDASYSLDQAQEGARQFVREIAHEVLDDVEVEYEVVGTVGDRSEQILQTAAGKNCDHVFMAGRKRSPTGKAVFGDATQRVILDYDGAVTVITA